MNCGGAVVLSDSWLIPTNNVDTVTLGPSKFHIYLKQSLRDAHVAYIYLILITKSNSKAEYFKDVLLQAIHDRATVYISLEENGVCPPHNFIACQNNLEGLLRINRKHAVPASNIAGVRKIAGKLVVFFCHPVLLDSTPQTSYILSFNTPHLLQVFFEDLIKVICIGKRLDYYEPE